MITKTVSLLNHIRSCQYLPNINTVEKMDELQKLNTDLISILDEYFKTNIWGLIHNKYLQHTEFQFVSFYLLNYSVHFSSPLCMVDKFDSSKGLY